MITRITEKQEQITAWQEAAEVLGLEYVVRRTRMTVADYLKEAGRRGDQRAGTHIITVWKLEISRDDKPVDD